MRVFPANLFGLVTASFLAILLMIFAGTKRFIDPPRGHWVYTVDGHTEQFCGGCKPCVRVHPKYGSFTLRRDDIFYRIRVPEGHIPPELLR